MAPYPNGLHPVHNCGDVLFRTAIPDITVVVVRRDPPPKASTLYACIAGLIVYNFLQSALRTVSQHLLERTITKTRKYLFDAMQSKMMTTDWKLTPHDPDVMRVMFSMDVERFCQTLWSVEVAVVGPMSLLAAFTILLRFDGVAALPALGLTVFTTILRVYMCTWGHELITTGLRWTTKRVTLLKDTISNTEVIKILCLEDRVLSRVLRYSSREFAKLWRSVFLLAYNRGVGQMAPRVSIYVTVLVLLRLNQHVTLQTTILVISYLRILEYHVFTRLPLSLTRLSQAWQYVQRFQDFLDGRDRESEETYREAILLDDPNLEEADSHQTSESTPSKHPQQKALSMSPWEPEPEVVPGCGGGACSWRVYWVFLTSWPGLVFVPFLVFCACATEVSGILTEWWIIKCQDPCRHTVDYSTTSGVNDSMLGIPRTLRADLLAYAVLVAVHVGSELLLTGLGAYLLTTTLTRLHTAMVRALLYTKLRTVSALPLGTALNAFSKDFIYFANYEFYSMYSVCTGSLRLMTLLLLMCITFPWIIVFIVLYAVGLMLLRVYTRWKARGQSKRLKVQDYCDTGIKYGYIPHPSPEKKQRWYKAPSVGFWHRFRVNLLTSVFCMCIILQITLSQKEENGRGPAALVLIYIITLLNCVQDSVGKWDLHGASLRKIMEYTQFEPEVKEGAGEWCDWPASGQVTFRHVSMPGSNLQSEPLDIVIPSGQKVGILCGDVTTCRAFLHTILALDVHPGHVFLDGLEVTRVSVHSLRTAITVIHPELVFRGGSLRDYLDPKQTFPDDTLWDALHKVGLKDKVCAFTSTLRFDLGNAYGHLDDGDRQLVGVTRAVIHNSQVVVVWTEEPYTDVSVECEVQDALRRLLPETTRIRITPSVRAIVSCDRVLVLEEGELSDYSDPWRLLVYGEPYYEQLAREVGHDEAAHIRTLTWDFYRQMTRMDSIAEEMEEEE